ncbi:MAG: hypothetical protein CVU57_21215 [Deltaproteobacteria bacterium HGW-Deltaproteobacteria-15]|jgi:hypothetical protein|nr:MAG: hypothetical protein CVU57_21215 [Deltaproteobacteria bacterium HGW-Deltaproteobacteria-15]
MLELSDQEKAQIRAEMEYREVLRRELEPPKGRAGKLWAAAAHPVVITVLGGLLLAGAGSLFQHVSALHQQQLVHQRQLQDKKFAVLCSFTEHFERDISILYNLRHMELVHKKSENGSDPGAKEKWLRIQDRYERMVEEHSKSHREVGVMLQVKALFTSVEVHGTVDKLDKKVRVLLNNTLSEPQIEQLGRDTEEGMRELAHHMGREINQAR